MIPFYFYYAMFGFQRTGDAIWQLGDIRAKGFLMGGTAGRTTLLGEGLQHQDGHSLLLASAYPAIRAYDPAFAYEVAVIVDHGLEDMFGEHPNDVVYYLTLYNENINQPAMPAGVEDGIVKGIYRYQAGATLDRQASILFSGSSAGEALRAAEILESEHGVGTSLYSVTSYKALRDEAREAKKAKRTPYVTQALSDAPGALVAVSDYVTLVPDQISPFIDRPLNVLGTDGFGCSDTREALRAHFGIDAESIVQAVLESLDAN